MGVPVEVTTETCIYVVVTVVEWVVVVGTGHTQDG